MMCLSDILHLLLSLTIASLELMWQVLFMLFHIFFLLIIWLWSTSSCHFDAHINEICGNKDISSSEGLKYKVISNFQGPKSNAVSYLFSDLFLLLKFNGGITDSCVGNLKCFRGKGEKLRISNADHDYPPLDKNTICRKRILSIW